MSNAAKNNTVRVILVKKPPTGTVLWVDTLYATLQGMVSFPKWPHGFTLSPAMKELRPLLILTSACHSSFSGTEMEFTYHTIHP